MAVLTRPPDGSSAALLATLARPAPDEVRCYQPLPPLPDVVERPITVDQTNHSVVIGERVVVKWYTPPAPPPQRAPDLLAHLLAAGFARTATPYAAVYRGGHLVALVTAYLPGAVDGWDWCVEAALAGRRSAADLG
ncbi:MAG TPA: hypothetical protein VKB69_16870, partial [Micromonosporaceae bacterium]|nr:hypothetical protein [Micromonosporaceae bacterium]